MSQFNHLRHAVTEGAPEQLFELGEYIVRALAVRLQSSADIKSMSGPEMAKIVLDWAKTSSEG